MSIAKIVEEGLREPRGTQKVIAALGELLTASAMFDLWLFQCLMGKIDVDPGFLETAGRRAETISKQVANAWATFRTATDRSDDHVAASADLIPPLLSAAKELREFLGELDFYNDAALSPIMDLRVEGSH